MAELAITHRYIQPNRVYQQNWLVFDVDVVPGVLAAIDAELPLPNLVVSNRPDEVNGTLGKAHLLYALAEPVCTSPLGRPGPLRFLARVERTYMRLLGADRGYSSPLCKNPLHPAWITISQSDRLYTLSELARGLDLDPAFSHTRSDVFGLGRNCALFEGLRKWAYTAWPRFSTRAEWAAAVLDRAEELNDFPRRLRFSEVRATAKSVAKWVWIRKPSQQSYCNRGLLGLSAEDGTPTTRQRLGAQYTAAVRRQKTLDRLQSAHAALISSGERPTQKAVAAAARLSQSTVKRHWAAVANRG